jgi:hypothetical protein
MPIRIVLCKARRAGLSTGVEATIFDDTTMNPNTYSLIVANEGKPSENVLKMCTRFWQNTPEYLDLEGNVRIKLRPDLPEAFRNNPPRDRLEFAKPLDSHIFIASAKSIDAYLSFGFQNIHATEASRYKNGAELFRALYPTLSTDAHSALYIESTPNGQDGPGAWFFAQCMDAYSRQRTEFGEMRLLFIPWHKMRVSFALPFGSDAKRQAFRKSLSVEERDVMRTLPRVSLEQMNWRRFMLNGPPFNEERELWDQEYPSDIATAFLMTGTSVFTRKAIKRIQSDQIRPPIWEGDIYWGKSDSDNEHQPIYDTIRRPCYRKPFEAIDEGRKSHTNEGTWKNLKVWRWPKDGDRVFIAADVGGGNPSTKEGDYSTILVGVLNELERDEIIMTWKGHINPYAFAEVASALSWAIARQVGSNVASPLLTPEWTGPGTGMCTYIDTKSLYANQYRYRVPGIHRMPSGKHIGWESNSKTTPIAMGAMTRMVERDLIDIPDHAILVEMASYRQSDPYGDEGSYGGAAGRHDDFVAALRILCALLRIESSTFPNTETEGEVSFGLADDDLPPWDPFATSTPVTGLPGVEWRDVGDENTEEALWYASD